jgi:hypothetical protein
MTDIPRAMDFIPNVKDIIKAAVIKNSLRAVNNRHSPGSQLCSSLLPHPHLWKIALYPLIFRDFSDSNNDIFIFNLQHSRS